MRQMEQSFITNPHAATIVPMNADFAGDSEMALTAVSYLPKEVSQTITTMMIEPLRSIEPSFYYYPIESMHLTVQNVRVIHDPPRFTAQDIDIARGVFRRAAMNATPFEFILQGILMMPTSVSIIALGTPKYDMFVKRLRSDLRTAGVPDDKTYFTDERVFANITMCRYTHAPSNKFLNMLHTFHDTYIGPMTVRETSLVIMNAGANRSKTTFLETYRFGQK